ncbi:MAG: rod shape-determining protein MreD [Bacteroidota bacterium]
MPSLLRLVLTGFGVVALQWFLLSRLPIYGVTPDAVLLFVTVVALRYGRVQGALAGFGFGLLADLLVNPSLLGLQAFAKTLMGFVVGQFRTEENELLRASPAQTALSALTVALVHNVIVIFVLALTQETRTLFLVTGLWLGSALYTAGIALVGAFLSRQSS